MLEDQKCKLAVMINKVIHKILNYYTLKNVLFITKKLSKLPEYKFVFLINLPPWSFLIFKSKIFRYKNLDYSKPHFSRKISVNT